MSNTKKSKEEKLAAWESTSKELKILKEKERQLRDDILLEYFDFAYEDRTGTENIPLANNFVLKSVFKLNYKLENKNNEVFKMTDKLKAAGLQQQLIDRLVKWKPELSVSEYKLLQDEYREIVDEILTTKAATPTLNIVIKKK